MIKSINEKPEKRIEIDLTKSEGNAWSLINLVHDLAKKLNEGIYNSSYNGNGLKLYDVDAIVKDMMSDDYEHLLSVMEKHFGNYIIMYR